MKRNLTGILMALVLLTAISAFAEGENVISSRAFRVQKAAETTAKMRENAAAMAMLAECYNVSENAVALTQKVGQLRQDDPITGLIVELDQRQFAELTIKNYAPGTILTPQVLDYAADRMMLPMLLSLSIPIMNTESMLMNSLLTTTQVYWRPEDFETSCVIILGYETESEQYITTSSISINNGEFVQVNTNGIEFGDALADKLENGEFSAELIARLTMQTYQKKLPEGMVQITPISRDEMQAVLNE